MELTYYQYEWDGDNSIVFLWPVKGELVELRNVARLNISKRIVINNKKKVDSYH